MRLNTRTRIENAERKLNLNRKPTIIVDWENKITDEEKKQIMEENSENLIISLRWV